MMTKAFPKTFYTLAAITLFLLASPPAEAAKLFVSPAERELGVGQTFEATVRINTEGNSFNAAQAVVRFPKDLLEIVAIDYSPKATIFNFWLEEPKFSNSDGAVSFIGGTTNGVYGDSVPILTITFRSKGSGVGDIVAGDAAITAADGDGTNILSTIQIARVTVNPEIVAPPPAPVTKAENPKKEAAAVASVKQTEQKQSPTPKIAEPKVAAETTIVAESPAEQKKPGEPLAAGAGSGTNQFWLMLGIAVLTLASFATGRLSMRFAKF